MEIGVLFLYDLVPGSLFLGVWVLHVEYRTLDFSTATVVTGFAAVLDFLQISHNFYVDVVRNPGVFLSVLLKMEKCARPMLQLAIS